MRSIVAEAAVTGQSPAGWPDAVAPPGAPGWVDSAARYLFDCCPADFRAYGVLRRHPVVLARFAQQFVSGQLDALQRGLPSLRTSLSRQVGPEVVEAAAQAWLAQEAHMVRTRRGVGLIEEALRGSDPQW